MAQLLINSETIGGIFQAAIQKAVPELALTVSQWADAYRFVENASENGRWQTSKTPYLREVMDCATDPAMREIVLMKSAQVGGTEAINNVIGFFAHIYPSPILVLQPTEKTARVYSKQKLEPMIRATPVLRTIFPPLHKKTTGNTTGYKEFPGGFVSIVGANSPADLAMKSIRLLLVDEPDRYPRDVGDEGDPVKLAAKRTTTFRDSKIFKVSTPTVKDESPIERAYEQSDKRKFYVPCPHCDHYQVLEWERLEYTKETPNPAWYKCSGCNQRIDHFEKAEMLRRGQWRAELPFRGVAGFWINELYSPWVTWGEMATEFLRVQDDVTELKTFFNTSLARTWDPALEDAELESLQFLKEEYPAEVPPGVVVVVAGVDVQKNRIEVEVVGYAESRESWSIGYYVLSGDTSSKEVWQSLKSLLETKFLDPNEHPRYIDAVAIDSGYNTEQVYRFVSENKGRRWFPVKGSRTRGKPPVSRPRNVGIGEYRVALYELGTEALKRDFHSRLRVQQSGPRACHFPDHYEEEIFKQYVAEKETTVKSKTGKILIDEEGRPVVCYKKIRSRNEALDCRCYADAALTILKPNWRELAKRFEPKAEQVTTPRKRGGGWMGGIR